MGGDRSKARQMAREHSEMFVYGADYSDTHGDTCGDTEAWRKFGFEEGSVRMDAAGAVDERDWAR